MSIFGNLFRKRPSKMDLVRRMLKARLRADPIAALLGAGPEVVDATNDVELMGTPEATIATIVETHATMKRQGVPEAQILELIENHRSMIGSDRMPSPLTLRSYIRYRVSLEHSASAPVSDASLDSSIQETRVFFEGE